MRHTHAHAYGEASPSMRSPGVADVLEDFGALMDTEWKLLTAVIVLTISATYSIVCWLLVRQGTNSRTPHRHRHRTATAAACPHACGRSG